MAQNIMVLFVCMVVITGLAGANAEPHGKSPKFKTMPEKVPDEYIVLLKPDSDIDQVAGLVKPGVADVPDKYQFGKFKGFTVKVKASKGNGKDELLDNLVNHPDVEVVEENSIFHAVLTQTSVPAWGLDRIDQTDLPLSTTYTCTLTGGDVCVFVLDTGIRPTHQQFKLSAGSTVSRVVSGWYTAYRNTNDGHGHGTHCAGTVGGLDYGVAKGVTLVAAKVLSDKGSGLNNNIITAINKVVSTPPAVCAGKPKVISMSLGGSFSSSLNLAVENAVATGVVVVVAAGNSNADACSYSPASAPSALTVGATTITDAKASYSNFGTCVDIQAPGSSIKSAWSTSDTATNTISGTSMATPHVAGAAAMILQANPTFTPAQVQAMLLASSVNNKVTGLSSETVNDLLNINGIATAP